MPPRVLDNGQRADVARRYAAGETLDDIAASVGVSSSTVRRAVIAADVPLRTTAARARVLDDAQAADVARRYAAGETTTELADAFRVSTTAVRRAIEEAGVAFRRRSWRLQPVPDVDGAIRRYQQGESIASIARDQGVPYKRLKLRLAAATDLRPRGRGNHQTALHRLPADGGTPEAPHE